MTETSDLSPFAHPKAQRYFATLLERSGFVAEVEEILQLDDDILELSHTRLLSAILLFIGRPGIWPDEQKRVLARAASRLSRQSKQIQESGNQPKKKRKPLTLSQHQRLSELEETIKVELELLRRRAGVSNRVSKIAQPESWGKLWS
ncbi:MAG: hypothetical protein AAF456_19775 [Planctomycetota bacterium]